MLELALCHGAIVVLAYKLHSGKRGEVRPNDIAVSLAETVNDELRLRKNWLETDIAIFIADAAVNHEFWADQFFPGVALSIGGAARVLAHKLHLLSVDLPAESTDTRDAELLLSKIGVSSPGQVKYIYERAFPGSHLGERAQELVQRAFHGRSLAKT